MLGTLTLNYIHCWYYLNDCMLREGSWVSRNTAVHPDELASRDVIIRVSDPFQSARAETDDNVL